jgi:hypothetical protein
MTIAVVHPHLRIIGVKGGSGLVGFGSRLVGFGNGLVGRICNGWDVVTASARVPNDHMTLFEVLNERMKVVQLETTTRVITAL